MAFHIDAHDPPALGPIEKDRFTFICSMGCGNCQPVLVTMRTRHHTIDGQPVDQDIHPEIVSSCCGNPMLVWDEKKDREADYPGWRTVSIQLPPQPAPNKSPMDQMAEKGLHDHG